MDLTKKTRAELLDMCSSIDIKGKHKLKKMDIINLINTIPIKTSNPIIATDPISVDPIIATDPIIIVPITATDPIITTDPIIASIKEDKIHRMSKLITLFKFCLDVLRNKEHLTGDKALRNLAYMLNLCLLEPQLQSLNIDNMAFYDFSEYGDDAERQSSRLLKLSRFSVLAKEKADNIPDIIKCLWEEVLSVHPIIKNIFPPGRGFDILHGSTFKKLIDKIASVDFTAFSEDILGEAYEEVIKDIMTGKVLGQFFTPPEVKEFMVDLIDPQILPNGTIETIFDPAMGTGGFLITALRKLLKKKEPMNWDFIIRYGLGGREPEPDTYQLAVSNMLIASGKMFSSLEKGDSIRTTISNKYDIILTNPPFGIDGLDYLEIKPALRNSYIPIISSSAVPLFLQAVIYILKINGRCAMILPEGQELFSKNKALVAVREYLMKTCNLREIIYLPSGTFTHTSIKTCIFYFQKKKEGDEIVILHDGAKESTRSYTFCPEHQTTHVEFYQRENGVKTLLGQVSIEEIAKNNYSLNYSEYIKKDDDVFAGDVNVMTLGEICNINIGGTPSRSIKEYYDYGINLWVSVRELIGGYIYDTKEKITDLGVQKSSVKLFDIGTVLFSFKLSIGKTAIVGSPLYSNEAIAGLISKDETILSNKFLYYYLSNTDFTKTGSGMLGNGSLNKKSLALIKIPIPPIAVQRDAVAQLDFIYKCIKTSEDKIAELQQLNLIAVRMHDMNRTNIMKPLGEVCTIFNGKRIVKNKVEVGEYPVLGGGGYTSFYTNIYTREGKTCKISREGMSLHNCVLILNEKYYLNSQAFTINSKNNILINEYLWYYLYNNKQQVFNCGRGTAQKAIDIEAFLKIKIIIPSFEDQETTIKYCEYNDALILQLHKEIEQNKDIALKFLTQIINSGITNFECDDIEEHDGDESKDGDEEHDGDEE
jgi:type I restriction-modification system DNA methylase subunit